MNKYNVECGSLKATILAATPQDACIQSLEFASGELGHDFFVWPAGTNMDSNPRLYVFPFDEIMIEAEWEMEQGE